MCHKDHVSRHRMRCKNYPTTPPHKRHGKHKSGPTQSGTKQAEVDNFKRCSLFYKEYREACACNQQETISVFREYHFYWYTEYTRKKPSELIRGKQCQVDHLDDDFQINCKLNLQFKTFLCAPTFIWAAWLVLYMQTTWSEAFFPLYFPHSH